MLIHRQQIRIFQFFKQFQQIPIQYHVPAKKHDLVRMAAYRNRTLNWKRIDRETGEERERK